MSGSGETTPPYLVVAGPTAVGKTSVSLGVAERVEGEIVIADSRQVYRGLDIGTAKPTAAERSRVPHHLLDVVDPGTPFDAAAWSDLARAAIREIAGRDRVPVVCGGTGFYLETLAGGLDPVGEAADPETLAAARARLETIPAEERRTRLAEVDPAATERIHPHDRQRVDRALEVWLATGRPWTSFHEDDDSTAPHLACRLTRDREELHDRIEARLDAMLDAGLEAEVRGLAEAGWSPDNPGLDTIGYQEWWPLFERRRTREEVRREILVATRRYAKRQETWFRNRGAYRPVEADGATGTIVEAWRRWCARGGG